MNEKFIVLEEIPKDFYAKKICDGTSSQCFQLNDGAVYKEFYSPELYVEIIKRLSMYSSKNILFPKQIVFLKDSTNENFKGYISDFATGVSLGLIDSDVNINYFLEHLELLERELFYYVRHGIIAKDLHKNNILYDKEKGFIIFDIAMFEQTNDDDFGEMYKSVLRDLSNTIVSEIIGNYQTYFNREDIKEIVLKCIYYYRLRPSTMIKNIIEIFEREGNEINTLGDFQKAFQIVPKL